VKTQRRGNAICYNHLFFHVADIGGIGFVLPLLPSFGNLSDCSYSAGAVVAGGAGVM
jgi:hypothetical protein